MTLNRHSTINVQLSQIEDRNGYPMLVNWIYIIDSLTFSMIFQRGRILQTAVLSSLEQYTQFVENDVIGSASKFRL